MPAYELHIDRTEIVIDLEPFRHLGGRAAESVCLASVATSRSPSRPIWNPSGLQADAIQAAERVALDRLATTGDGVSITVVKVLADSRRREVSVSATLDPRRPGRAIVDSHTRGARSVAIAAIVEAADGERSYSALVALAADVARRVAAGEAEADVVAALAAESNKTPRAIADRVAHGVAIARAQADLARAGRAPLVAVAR